MDSAQTGREYSVNAASARNPLWQRIVPPVTAVAAIVLFVNLGLWQLDRAAQKEALAASFEDGAAVREIGGRDMPEPFERVALSGRFLSDRQVLIDNIVKNGQLGYYVVTPLELSRSGAVLLVNRGWIGRGALNDESVSLDLSGERGNVEGRAGNLPRVGVRGGPGFATDGDTWPRIGVYPTPEEVADQLDRDVLPWTLLLSPGDERGYLRDWRPSQSGPGTHYGYAFQWFAMALAVVAIAAWNFRKRGRAG